MITEIKFIPPFKLINNNGEEIKIDKKKQIVHTIKLFSYQYLFFITHFFPVQRHTFL